MKRSGPLLRKTPLKAGGRLKRTSMKRNPPTYPPSKLAKQRTDWGKQHPFCWLCLKEGTETHEIASKAQAPKRWAHVCNYARVGTWCSCHLKYAAMSMARQLAHKMIFDEPNYDLELWLLIYKHGPECVTQLDVSIELADVARGLMLAA